MPLLFLLIFILVPLAEIAVLIKVGDVIGLAPTLLIIIASAVIGIYLLRQQGLNALFRAQQALGEGRMPIDSVVDAAALLVAGALLLTPGLITDAIGYALLVPPLRHWLARKLFERARQSPHVTIDIFGTSSRTGGARPHKRGPFGRDRRPPDGPGPIIEGEIIEPENSGERDDHSGKPGDDDRSPWKRR